MSSMQTIAVVNAKGGSGKTTVSINLASYYAHTGRNTVVIDYDAQGSSTHWISTRNENQPYIHSIPAYKIPIGSTQTFQMKLANGTERVIIDTPGAISPQQLEKIVKRTDFILVPVQPSSIDIHATTMFVQQLLRMRQVQWGKVKVAVIANRVATNRTQENNNLFAPLITFLNEQNIPFLSKVQDSQHYVQAANEAKGIFEIEHSHSVAKDKSDWHAIINWVEQKEVFTELSVVPTAPSISSTIAAENASQLEQAI